MLEVIKPLLDSDLVNEETRAQITEAWDAKLLEIREEVTYRSPRGVCWSLRA